MCLTYLYRREFEFGPCCGIDMAEGRNIRLVRQSEHFQFYGASCLDKEA